VLQSYNMGPSYVDQDGSFEENAKKTIEAVISQNRVHHAPCPVLIMYGESGQSAL
jgi:hypothetical protein